MSEVWIQPTSPTEGLVCEYTNGPKPNTITIRCNSRRPERVITSLIRGAHHLIHSPWVIRRRSTAYTETRYQNAHSNQRHHPISPSTPSAPTNIKDPQTT